MSPQPNYTYTFYGITGQALARVTCNGSNYPAYPTCAVVGQNVYFGGNLIVAGGVNVVTDRLGSVRANGLGESFTYYTYGEERTGTAAGQDYADQRYYGSGTGSFWSPDPGGIKTASAADPGSWNRYSYVQGDPINFYDPQGLLRYYPGPFGPGYGINPFGPSAPGEGGGLAGSGTRTLNCAFAGAGGANHCGDDPGDSDDPGPATLPTLGGPYASKKISAIFARAVKEEEAILSNSDCARLIGGSANSTGGEVDATIDDATWNVDLIPDSQSPGGVLPNPVAAVTDPSTQTVTINVLGGFVTPTQTLQSLPGVTFNMLAPIQALVPGISMLDAQAFILLHETAHLTGALGPDRNDQPAADAFNQKIAKDCFHQ